MAFLGFWVLKLNYNSSPSFPALLPFERYDPHRFSWEGEGQEISSSVTASRWWGYVVLPYWRQCNSHPSWSKWDGDFSVLFWYWLETHWKYSWSLTVFDILRSIHSVGSQISLKKWDRITYLLVISQAHMVCIQSETCSAIAFFCHCKNGLQDYWCCHLFPKSAMFLQVPASNLCVNSSEKVPAKPTFFFLRFTDAASKTSTTMPCLPWIPLAEMLTAENLEPQDTSLKIEQKPQHQGTGKNLVY